MQYLGIDVLTEFTPDRGSEIASTFSRPGDAIPNAPGKSAFTSAYASSRESFNYPWLCVSRAEIEALHDFIDRRRGRAVPVWVPTYRRDMRLALAITPGQITFSIVPCYYTAMSFPPGWMRRHVAFYAEATSPSVFARIVDASDSNPLIEALTVASPFAGAHPTTEVISFLLYCRLDTDRVRIERYGNDVARAILPFIELAADTPSP